MPQWASAEGGGSEAESPDQMMLYYEDETSQYYDNKSDIADKIEQAGGEICIKTYSLNKRHMSKGSDWKNKESEKTISSYE